MCCCNASPGDLAGQACCEGGAWAGGQSKQATISTQTITSSATTARDEWEKLVDRRWRGREAMQAMRCRCLRKMASWPAT